ncbi:MAG TPA: hypothetical protein DD381_12760 [Lentisphaeria bacterium]|nr:MAG: hypothetical protein A2X47_12330 [Lentisphaerae bacterium GWF2_38_69]HBM17195.1 hypothetical protein [Lentisphaeria bacterium]
MKRIAGLICCIAFITVFSSFAEQITIIKQASLSNPKLIYNGMTGNQEFSEYVKSNLQKCGWFDVIPSGTAKYTVDGIILGNKATLNVKGEINFNVSINIDPNNSKWSSYKLVDLLLNKIFNIPGICASRFVFVAQHNGKKDLMIADFDGSNVKQLTGLNALALEPSWCMNNSLIVYTLIHNNFADVIGLNLSSGKNTVLANFPGLNTGGAISPNGKQMALILSKDKNVDLYVKKAYGGKELMKITKGNGAVAGCPAWSPDSRKLCFVSNMKMNRPSLYIADIDSGKIYPIRTLGGEAVSPSWSPDGSKIVYSAKMGSNYTLGVYDIEAGTTSLVEINSAGDWFSSSWAPDSRHVVCSRRLNYFSQLYVVDTLSGEARKGLNSKYNTTSPDWSALYR